ncbi:unnamed protein product, partial [Discosporangium mesarthrocarpum]
MYSFKRQDLARMGKMDRKGNKHFRGGPGIRAGGAFGKQTKAPKQRSSPLSDFLPRPDRLAYEDRGPGVSQHQSLKILLHRPGESRESRQRGMDKKRKRMSGESSRGPVEDLYTVHRTNSRRDKNREREDRPRFRLREKLRGIHEKLRKHEQAGHFKAPVNKKVVPGYYDKIKNPVDLSAIAGRVDSFTYKSSQAFLEDVKLMRDNAVHFNGEDHIIGQASKAILACCEELIKEEEDDLKGIEDAIQQESESSRLSKRSKGNTARG